MNKVGIFVTNLEKMVSFYRDIMKLNTSWDSKSKDVVLYSDNMTLIMFPRVDFELMISKKLSYPDKVNGTFELAFEVDTFKKVDEKFEELVKKGVEVIYPPNTENWGQRTCFFKDPDGNLIELSSFNDLIEKFESPRLLMRPFDINDSEDVFEYASDEETVKYLSWPKHTSLEESREIVENNLMKEGIYAIEEKSIKKVIGCIDLRFIGEEKLSFGYVLNKKYWNKGFMSEVLKSLINYVFKNLRISEIEGVLEKENIASARVMEKCGMKWAFLEKDENICGKVTDNFHYKIFKKDYLK